MFIIMRNLCNSLLNSKSYRAYVGSRPVSGTYYHGLLTPAVPQKAYTSLALRSMNCINYKSHTQTVSSWAQESSIVFHCPLFYL